MSSEKYQMLAKTFAGLENVLKAELEEIGASDVEAVVRGVKFSGSKEILYKANFCCRTALRILRIIGEYPIKSSNDLYQSIYKIDWSLYFNVDQTFAVISTVDSEAFNNSMYVGLKTKDAIVDQFKTNTGKRPFLNIENPEIKINIHASSNDITVWLDSSGESLNKRGYRVGQNEASMNEVVAAGILKMAGWKGQSDFYDGMCGSGTIPIEAALIARNIPPGIFRKSFAFESWKGFDAELFEKVYNDDYEVSFEHTIFASDISALSIKIAEKNARSAGLKSEIDFKMLDFSTLIPTDKNSLLVINPPVGERNDRKMEPLYSMIGDSLKKNFAGCKAWIIGSSDEAFRSIGLRPSEKIQLNNGSADCSFCLYELFNGSERDFKPWSANNKSENIPFPDRGRDSRPERRSSDTNTERRNDAPRTDRRGTDSRPERRSFDSNPGRRSDAPRTESRGSDFRSDRRSFDSPRGENKGSDFRSNRRPSDAPPGRRTDAPRGENRGGEFRPDRRSGDSRPERRDGKFNTGGQSNSFKSDKSGTGFVSQRPVKENFTEILSSELKHTDRKGVFQPKDKPKIVNPEKSDGKVRRKRIK